MPELFAAAPGEGPPPEHGPVRRVALLADVHANVPALRAVLAEVDEFGPDLVVFCGDLTWGPEPDRTVEIVADLGERAVCVRGNADRAVVELARGGRPPRTERESWMLARHSAASVDFVAGFPFTAVVRVDGLGAVRCCHGSPRGDTELITPGTPTERMAELGRLVDERVLASGHTHLQFDRLVAGLRSVNAGSVGLPYHTGEPGTAYWATLGTDVHLRRSRYDVSEAVARCHETGDPKADTIASMLLSPPTPSEIVAHAEQLVFSD